MGGVVELVQGLNQGGPVDHSTERVRASIKRGGQGDPGTGDHQRDFLGPVPEGRPVGEDAGDAGRHGLQSGQPPALALGGGEVAVEGLVDLGQVAIRDTLTGSHLGENESAFQPVVLGQGTDVAGTLTGGGGVQVQVSIRDVVIVNPLGEVGHRQVEPLARLVASDDADQEGFLRYGFGGQVLAGREVFFVGGQRVEEVGVDAEGNDVADTLIAVGGQLVLAELRPYGGARQAGEFPTFLVLGIDREPGEDRGGEDGLGLFLSLLFVDQCGQRKRLSIPSDLIQVGLHVPRIIKQNDEVRDQAMDETGQAGDAEQVHASVDWIVGAVYGEATLLGQSPAGGVGRGVARFVDAHYGDLVARIYKSLAGGTGAACEAGIYVGGVAHPEDLHA